MQIPGINAKLSEAYRVDDLYVEMNDCELEDGVFVGHECVYGGEQIKGFIQYLDHAGMTAGEGGKGQDIREGGFVTLGSTDASKCEQKQKFAITSITKTKDKKGQELIQLGVVDSDTRNMKGTFITRGYPDKKYSEVIEKHWKEVKNERKLEIVKPKYEEKLNMVIHGAKDFQNILVSTAKEKNWKFVQDKSKTYLVHKEHSDFTKRIPTGEVFEFDAEHNSLSRILQFNIDGFSSEVMMEAPRVTSTSNDDTTVNSKDNQKGMDGKVGKNKPKDSPNNKEAVKGVKVKDLAATRGSRQLAVTGNDKQYYDALQNAQKMSIWVPGKHIDRVGKTVEVNLPAPKGIKADKYDPVFSGVWEVVYQRDKFYNYYFVQELMLRRPGK